MKLMRGNLTIHVEIVSSFEQILQVNLYNIRGLIKNFKRSNIVDRTMIWMEQIELSNIYFLLKNVDYYYLFLQDYVSRHGIEELKIERNSEIPSSELSNMKMYVKMSIMQALSYRITFQKFGKFVAI